MSIKSTAISNKNINIINELLSPANLEDSNRLVSLEQVSTLAIFVHSSVFEQFRQFMNISFNIKAIGDVYDYELKVGNTNYSMKLIYLHNHYTIIDRITQAISLGRCSFIFSDKPNLFITEERYHELQMFIHHNHLESHIVHRETRYGLISDVGRETKIIVVTFNEFDSWWNIPTKFMEFLRDNFSPAPLNYYQTVAFPWLQPSRLVHFKKSIPSKSYFIIHQFLICLRELSYDRESHASLIDLCNLRLAFCNDRGMNQWDADLAYEIDALIIRSLDKLKRETNLFINNKFDVMHYISTRNVLWSFATVRFFQYKFQNYFDSILLPDFRLNSFKNNTLENMSAIHSSTKTIRLVDYPGKNRKKIGRPIF